LELKTFKDDKVDIQKQIVAEFATCGFPEPEKFTENALKQGKLLILLDGLDEVPKVNTNAVITQIEDFVDRYDKNRFISSCRIAAYRSKFRRFFDVAMADFDNEQISEFINNWFRSEKDKLMGTAQKCWELLQNDENEAAMELARTPLLLTFLCLVYDRSQGFSSNRSSLYSKALRIWRCKYS
jgi:predicted NACHT family NTPase